MPPWTRCDLLDWADCGWYVIMLTKLPGIKVRHAMISDVCRENKTDEGAIDEALVRLKESYMDTIRHWPIGKEAEFHVVLTVEYPRAGDTKP